jgi:hypothetical protein
MSHPVLFCLHIKCVILVRSNFQRYIFDN